MCTYDMDSEVSSRPSMGVSVVHEVRRHLVDNSSTGTRTEIRDIGDPGMPAAGLFTDGGDGAGWLDGLVAGWSVGWLGWLGWLGRLAGWLAGWLAG